LKIAYCTPWKVRCGIYKYTKNLAEAVTKLGHEVFIVRLPRFGAKSPELLSLVANHFPKDVDVFVISHEYGLYSGLEGGFYGELKHLHPDKPIITIAHAVGYNIMIDRVLAGASDKVIVHNEFCRKKFIGDATVIHHGCLDLVNCPPEEECKKVLGIPMKTPLVGYIGFITPAKGLEYVINAMAKVPDAALLIGGGYHTGQTTGYIQQLKERSVRLLSGRVQWLGYVDDNMLATVYGAIHMLVYPSIVMSESGAMLMALSHQKAVIASSLKPVKEKEKQGALTTFKNVRELRRKIRKLLSDDEYREKLVNGARDYVTENSWKNVAKQHIKLYEEVLANKNV